MPRKIARIIVAIMTIGALTGCEQAGAPPGTPGSLTLSLHGRVESGVSVSPH
jgi:hypothetical protein